MLHWGMAIATYPIFGSLAGAAGKRFRQGMPVGAVSLQRTAAARYGDTPPRFAAPRIIQTWEAWGLVRRTSEDEVNASPPSPLGKDELA